MRGRRLEDLGQRVALFREGADLDAYASRSASLGGLPDPATSATSFRRFAVVAFALADPDDPLARDFYAGQASERCPDLPGLIRACPLCGPATRPSPAETFRDPP